MNMSCCCDDGDAPALFRKSIRMARIAHICSDCHGLIHAGERYEYVVGVWDGKRSVFTACCRCLAVIEFVRAAVPCLCTYYGKRMRVDDAIEAARDYSYKVPGLLFGALRRQVLIERHFERHAKQVVGP